MKIVNRIIIGLVLLIGGFFAFAATRPNSFRVERSIHIKAPAAKLFPYINDFHKGAEWSPWEKTDAQMQRTYKGSPSGKGSIYEWAGNKEAGKGRMEIVESVTNERVKVAMHFIEPMEGDNSVEYILTAKGDITNVKWVIYGPMPYISKVVCIFFDMDKMIGNPFEKGLATLKQITEKP